MEWLKKHLALIRAMISGFFIIVLVSMITILVVAERQDDTQAELNAMATCRTICGTRDIKRINFTFYTRTLSSCECQ